MTKRNTSALAAGRIEALASSIKAASMDTDALVTGNLITFIETLQIITKEDGRKPLIFNKGQDQIWHWFLERREKKEPPRAICLKSRRLGISTLISAICFALTYHYPYRFALQVAHDWDGGGTIFGIVKTMWDYLPKEAKRLRSLQSKTKRTLKYAFPHDSVFKVATANNPNLGSAQLIHYLHLSELAKWLDPNDSLTSVLQPVPNHWDSLVFIESTARGKNIFYQRWKTAEKGDGGYTPIFLTWKGFPEYFFPRLITPLKPIDDPAQEAARLIALETEMKEPVPTLNPDSDEAAFQQKYEVLDKQMKWFRTIREDQCHDDWAEANQEYPIEPELAFKVSGWPWFSADIMDYVNTTVEAPEAIAELVWFSDVDPVVKVVDATAGRLWIWEYPKRDYVYVLGMDVGEGIGAAYSVIDVIRLPNDADDVPVQVAQWRSNQTYRHGDQEFSASPAFAAVEAFKLGCFYNQALIGVERNNHGNTVLEVLQQGHAAHPQMRSGYPSLYYHVVPATKNREETKRLGWQTDKATRPKLFNHFRAVMLSRQLIVRSQATATEMSGIQYDSTNIDWVQELQDERTKLMLDDCVFSAGIALQMVEVAKRPTAMPPAADGGW